MTANESIQQQNTNQPVVEKSKLFKSQVTNLTVIGILLVVAGLINLYGAMTSGFSSTALADVIFNTAFGALIFTCSRILAKGKVLAIWFLGGCVLLSIVYSFAMGRGFNFVVAAGGAFLIWQLFTLKKQGELS